MERNLKIKNEAEFILKVRNKYYRQINNRNATTIQAFVRGFLTRLKYKKFRNIRILSAIKIQAFIKMKLIRRLYLRMIRYMKEHSALIIQKYMKGYKVFQVLKDRLHRLVIDRMVNHFAHLKEGLYLDSQIKIRFAWKLYLRRK